jgi:hypothetical protein
MAVGLNMWTVLNRVPQAPISGCNSQKGENIFPVTRVDMKTLNKKAE